jgi:hypothetical protein
MRQCVARHCCVISKRSNLSVKTVPLPPCRRKWGVGDSSSSFLASALDGVSGQRHASATLHPLERTCAHRIGGWVDFGAGLDTETRGKILCKGSNPGRPVCSQTIYSLSYPSSFQRICTNRVEKLVSTGCIRKVYSNFNDEFYTARE